MIISDLNYLETAAHEVTGGGWRKYFNIEVAKGNKQVNFNATKQNAKAVSFNKYSKYSIAVAKNDNNTFQSNEIN